MWLALGCSESSTPGVGPDARGPDSDVVDAVPRPDTTSDATTRDAPDLDSSVPDSSVMTPEVGFSMDGPGDVETTDAVEAQDAGFEDARVICPPPQIPPPDPDPWAMGLPDIAPPTFREVRTGHTDQYLVGPGGVAEIGIRLNWGGTVVFFGMQGQPGSNTIDANDTGREVQVALYDPERMFQGCAHDASCQGTNPCGDSITFLGWDPVQGGDECGRGATATVRLDGARMIATLTPLQWNPDWAAPDCRRSGCSGAGDPVGVTYELGFRFVHSNVVELSMQLDSSEAIDHAATTQEFPTLYAAKGSPGTDLPVLLDPTGAEIIIDQLANDGFRTRTFQSPSPWVTWQHAARDYGVGLRHDNAVALFQAWSGDGSSAPYFHNVRAVQSFGIKAGGTVRGRAYLALGSFDTIGTLLEDLLMRRAPFGTLDSPASGAALSVGPNGSVPISGWVLDDGGSVVIRAVVDGSELATFPRGQARPDVCEVYPGYAECPNVGFAGTVTLPGLAPCGHSLELIAEDSNGNLSVIGRRTIEVF